MLRQALALSSACFAHHFVTYATTATKSTILTDLFLTQTSSPIYSMVLYDQPHEHCSQTHQGLFEFPYNSLHSFFLQTAKAFLQRKKKQKHTKKALPIRRNKGERSNKLLDRTVASHHCVTCHYHTEDYQ